MLDSVDLYFDSNGNLHAFFCIVNYSYRAAYNEAKKYFMLNASFFQIWKKEASALDNLEAEF